MDIVAEGQEVGRVARSRAAAGSSASPSAILDQLASDLPPQARTGLAVERARAGTGRAPTAAGDQGVLRTLEGRQRGGRDVSQWLAERGLDPTARRVAHLEVARAEAALARARLVEAEAMTDTSPAVGRAVRTEFRRHLLECGRALLRADFGRLREGVRASSVDTVTGELGEALGRDLLARQAAPGSNAVVVSGLELAERVSSGRISDYIAAERAAGRAMGTREIGLLRQGPDGVYRSLGQVDGMLGERLPDGRIRPDVIEEVKTGARETAADAMRQAERAVGVMDEIGRGESAARIFERPTPNTVGADLTHQPVPDATNECVPGQLDTLRVRGELGVTAPHSNTLYACLARCVARKYRSQIAAACWAHATADSAVALVMYDLTVRHEALVAQTGVRDLCRGFLP